MVMEADRHGMERNRQAEFFFNGLVGHVRSYDGGTSTAGTRPLDLPITGVVTTTSPKYMMKIPRGPHRGKIATDRLTMLTTPLEPMVNSQNPKWKTTLQ